METLAFFLLHRTCSCMLCPSYKLHTDITIMSTYSIALMETLAFCLLHSTCSCMLCPSYKLHTDITIMSTYCIALMETLAFCLLHSTCSCICSAASLTAISNLSSSPKRPPTTSLQHCVKIMFNGQSLIFEKRDGYAQGYLHSKTDVGHSLMLVLHQ